MHGISRDFCKPCSSNHPSAQPAVGNEFGPTTTAGYEQQCPWCGEQIEIGERMGLRDGEFVCDFCTTDHDEHGGSTG
jgi:hypothetical protein